MERRLNEFLKTSDKNKCCGCLSCVYSCPKKCINTEKDREGFIYPIITDMNSCINCGMCRNVCPIEKNDFINSEKMIIGAVNKNRDDLLKSSSGGVFIAFAKNVIRNNGIVYGVSFENLIAKYERVTKVSDLNNILGSKYLQADLNELYLKVKEDLNKEKNVLVCGTPCYIAGLKKYLGKNYDNLITIDFICHGVPSQKIFDLYIKEIKKKGNVKEFKFRDKTIHGWGISATYIDVQKNKIVSKLSVSSPYIWAYLKNLIHRPVCYTCPYASENRSSDITIGDFWNMDYVDCTLDDSNGVSIIKINNQKGKKIFNSISDNFEFQVVDYGKSLYTNEALYKPSKKPIERDQIYSNIDKMDFKKIVNKYFKMPNQLIVRIKSLIPKEIRNNIKNIINKFV